MFRTLEMRHFKSFTEAKLPLSPFTLLVGANASGKSNIREAFRFLHGVSRGYTLSETVGEKWIEGGVKVWTGLRGGGLQVAQHGHSVFSVRAKFDVPQGNGQRALEFDYRVDVQAREDGTLRVEREHLWENSKYIFDTHPDGEARGANTPTIKARIRKYGGGYPPDDSFLDDRPLLTQLRSSGVATDATRRAANPAIDFLASMVFLDLSPHAARESSPVGIKTLGDRGENLSSVLEEIARDKKRKSELMSWVRALTPMDASDIGFLDFNGRTLAQLVESDGTSTPLSSASDGTVRFLAMIAALMSPTRPRFLFFEEIENGIHPNRVYLLLDLITQSVGRDRSQVVATSHSPQMLVHAYRAKQARPCLVVRSEAGGSRIVDVRNERDFSDVIDKDDPASLMAAGWFEDVAAFLNPAADGES